MKSIVVSCLALGFWAMLGSTVHAFCFPVCLPTCCVNYELRPVICYRAEWREEKVPCVIQHVNYRKEVTPVSIKVKVPMMFDEQVRTSCYVPAPREVERDVWRCVIVPVVIVDPCTCCPCVTFTSQWVAQRVRCVEYDYRRVDRVENVKVCRYVAQDRVIEQIRWIPEVSQEQTWTVRRYCVMVPYQSMAWMPCWR